MARRLRVAEPAPKIDGAALDLVIDYLTSALVQVRLIRRGGLFPQLPGALEFRRLMKTFGFVVPKDAGQFLIISCNYVAKSIPAWPPARCQVLSKAIADPAPPR